MKSLHYRPETPVLLPRVAKASSLYGFGRTPPGAMKSSHYRRDAYATLFPVPTTGDRPGDQPTTLRFRKKRTLSKLAILSRTIALNELRGVRRRTTAVCFLSRRSSPARSALSVFPQSPELIQSWATQKNGRSSAASENPFAQYVEI